MANPVYAPHKSSLGLDANLVMLIAYLGGAVLSFIPVLRYFSFAVPIVLFFIEKASPYVKFHAAQAIILQVIGSIFSILISIVLAIANGCLAVMDLTAVFGLVALVGVLSVISWVISIVLLVFEIICLVQSWKYECYKLPLVGSLAEKLAARFPII